MSHGLWPKNGTWNDWLSCKCFLNVFKHCALNCINASLFFKTWHWHATCNRAYGRPWSKQLATCWQFRATSGRALGRNFLLFSKKKTIFWLDIRVDTHGTGAFVHWARRCILLGYFSVGLLLLESCKNNWNKPMSYSVLHTFNYWRKKIKYIKIHLLGAQILRRIPGENNNKLVAQCTMHEHAQNKMNRVSCVSTSWHTGTRSVF